MVCGIRVEEIEDPSMREAQNVDTFVDELTRGKKLENSIRGERYAAAFYLFRGSIDSPGPRTSLTAQRDLSTAAPKTGYCLHNWVSG